ncbi:MAG: hypothetical protein ACE5GT_05885 [Rhodospirillales bacterium]
MNQPTGRLDDRRNAQRLIKMRRTRARDYVAKVVERMRDKRDEGNLVYWERISEEVERMPLEPDSDD